MKGPKIILKVSDERIAIRAFERWMGRGCPRSDGTEDWFAAQAELEAEMVAALAPKTAASPKRKPAAKKVMQIEA